MSSTDRQVVFDFDDGSLRTLQQMTSDGGYKDMADCLRESLQITRAMQTQAQEGFTQVILRNPRTGGECVVKVSLTDTGRTS